MFYLLVSTEDLSSSSIVFFHYIACEELGAAWSIMYPFHNSSVRPELQCYLLHCQQHILLGMLVVSRHSWIPTLYASAAIIGLEAISSSVKGTSLLVLLTESKNLTHLAFKL